VIEFVTGLFMGFCLGVGIMGLEFHRHGKKVRERRGENEEAID
tara:strand:- start:1539 stop:1667 length:129 start_codon:yes stop_codon:yes gene_type:complete